MNNTMTLEQVMAAAYLSIMNPKTTKDNGHDNDTRTR